MSIFDKYPQLENKIINNKSSRDDEFDTLYELFGNFLLEYENNSVDQNVKQLCIDAKQLFFLNSVFFENCLKEMEEDSEPDDDDKSVQLYIQKTKKMIDDTKKLIKLFPEESLSNQETLLHLNGINHEIKTLANSIIDYYQEISDNMKSINNTFRKIGQTLNKTVLNLKAYNIRNELEPKINLLNQSANGANLKQFLINYTWFVDNYLEVSDLIKQYPNIEPNDPILIIQDSLLKIVNKWMPMFKKISKNIEK